MRKTSKAMAKALDQLIKGEDRWVADRAKRLRDQLRLPMVDILKKVTGESLTEKAAKCGVSRQAYYGWINGLARPNAEQAKRLSKMTGYTVEQIRGREDYTPPRVNPVPVKRKRKPRKPVETAGELV